MYNGSPEGNVQALLAGMGENIAHNTIGAYMRTLDQGSYKGFQQALADYSIRAQTMQDSGIGQRGIGLGLKDNDLSSLVESGKPLKTPSIPRELLYSPGSCAGCYN
jgi:hypothetical protein